MVNFQSQPEGRFSTEYRTWANLLHEHVTTILLKRGPMTEEALKYFLHTDADIYISKSDLIDYLNFGPFKNEVNRWHKVYSSDPYYELYKKDHCLRLVGHEADPITIPPHEDYIRAYHDLHALMQELRKLPALSDIPDSYFGILTGQGD